MWQFKFFIDYSWIEKRRNSKEYCVLVNDSNLSYKNIAWNWLKDTFQIENMEYSIAEKFRFIDAQFISK